MREVEFTRLGGLSAVDYPDIGKDNYHYPPPFRKGIYAFVYPYIEIFLVAWKKDFESELKNNGFRKFKFNGYLWCHFIDLAPKDSLVKGSWVRVHTDDYSKMLQKKKIQDASYVMKADVKWMTEWDKIRYFIPCSDPYKRGCGGSMARDHLEVFIEKSQLGRIR